MVRKGRVVTVGGYLTGIAVTNGVAVATIPEGYRAAANVSGIAQTTGNIIGVWATGSGGNIVIYMDVTSNERVNLGSISWGI